MDNERVNELIDGIEANFRELAKITGADHISAFIISGRFSIDDLTNIHEPKFSAYRTEANNE